MNPLQEPYQRSFWLRQSQGRIFEETVSDTRGHALAAVLGRVYPEVMQKAWDYLHPEEMAMVKKQAEKARRLKRF